MAYNDFLTVSGGSPFRYEINGLARGTVYYVRVKARNSQGFGPYQVSVPSAEYPRELPSAPTSTELVVTSGRVGDGKLTVTWAMPVSNGGDEVTAFVVKWDVYPQFNSLNLLPEKGQVSVAVTDSMSYTISNLVVGKAYWVSVGATNKVGTRFISTPMDAVPALRKSSPTLSLFPPSRLPPSVHADRAPVSCGVCAELPGKPSSVVLSLPGVCVSTGCITVSWNFPIVPYHSVFCSGGGTVHTAPYPCPTTMGRGTQADGGAPITSYTIEWSRNSDFCTIDNSADVPSDAFTYVIQNLTPGLQYYVRVYAANSQGRGDAQLYTGLLGDGAQLALTP